MGKYSLDENDENDENQKPPRGRPFQYSISRINQNLQYQTNQRKKLFWFQDNESRKIMQILATKSQIQFKCLSGKSAIKQLILTQNNDETQYKQFKKFRQKFAKNMTKLQIELIGKLEIHFKISLLNKDKKMDYFFFQDNTNSKEISCTSSQTIDLISPYIHKDFIKTLKTLINIEHTDKSQDFTALYVNESHTHLACWAFVSAWARNAQNQMEKLYTIEQSPLSQLELEQAESATYNLIINKNKELLWKIEEIIKEYDKMKEEEINDLIDKFSKRNVQNIN